MGGFFGVVSKNDAVLDTFFGVDYHSHLGTRRAGMAVYDEELGTGKIYEDIVVTELTRGGIAERLGLQLGDRLTHMTVDGVTYELNQSHVIGDLLLKLTPGTRVTITYLRQAEGETEYAEGTTNELTIVLADLSVVE